MFHPYLLLCRVLWISEFSPAYTRHKPCRRQTALFCANSRKSCAFDHQSVFRPQQPLATRCFVSNTLIPVRSRFSDAHHALFQFSCLEHFVLTTRRNLQSPQREGKPNMEMMH